MSDLKKIYPYDDTLYKFKVTGAVLTKIFTHNMRLENRIPGESVYLQVSKGVEAVYRDAEEKLESLTIHGQPVQDNTQYTIAIDNYRYQNAFYWLGVTEEELTHLGNSKVITTSCQDVLEEYFGYHQNLNSQIEGRLVYK